MNYSARSIAAILLLGLAFSSAQATPVLFDPSNEGSKVSAEIIDCLGFCGISATMQNLDGMSASLYEGQTWTFDFFEISVGGLGIASYAIEATLAFASPGGLINGAGGGAFATAFGKISGGILTWIGQPGLVDLGNGMIYSVWLENVIEGGLGNSTMISATVGLVSVPEPGTLALFGLGLIGLALSRRRRV